MPEFAPINIPEGPLINAHIPQITGAESPKLEDPGVAIVAAAAKGAEINGRVRAMESRLMQMQLEEKNKDIEHNLAVQRMAQQADIAQRTAVDRESMNNARISDLLFKQNWKEDTVNDYQGLVQDLHDAKVNPSDPNYWSTILDVESRHPKSAMTTAGRQLHVMHGADFNKAAAAEANAAYAEDRSIKSDIKGLDWHGLVPTTAIFEDPRLWQSKDRTDQQGNPILDPNTKKPLQDKYTYLGKNQLQQDQWLTLPEDRYQAYQMRWNHAQNRLGKIQEQVSDPYGQIPKFPVDTTGGTGPSGATAQDPVPINSPADVQKLPSTVKFVRNPRGDTIQLNR